MSSIFNSKSYGAVVAFAAVALFVGVAPSQAAAQAPAPATCSVVITSDASDFVIQKEANAQLLSTINPGWTASLGSAAWIWGDDPVTNPTATSTQTFRKQFGFIGTVTSATLEVASDNEHVAKLNAGTANAGGSSFAAPASYAVPVTEILQGNNTLLIDVTNFGVAGSDATANPAGLLYRLTINGTPTTDADCVVPYPYVPPVVEGCTDSDATNYNSLATPGNPQAAACDIDYASQCESPNLLANGSFEAPAIAGPWSLSAVTDWVVTKVSDSTTTLAEIWRGLSQSSQGAQHVELDAAEATKLSQTVATIPGATYEFRFDFAARSATAAANNAVIASAGTNTIANVTTGNTEWTTYGGTFVASAASTTLSIADAGASADQLGTLVDNTALCLVRLAAPTCTDGILNQNETTTDNGGICTVENEGSSNGGSNRSGTRVTDRTPAGEVLGASDTATPLVLGEQVTAVPTGAPNTGKGGASVTIIGQLLALPRRRNV